MIEPYINITIDEKGTTSVNSNISKDEVIIEKLQEVIEMINKKNKTVN